MYIEQRHNKRHSKRQSKRHSKPALVTALLQVTVLYCNFRTVLLLATFSLLPSYRLGVEIEQRNSKVIKPLDRAIALDRLGPATWAMAQGNPRIQLVHLNTLYRQARLP